MPDLEQHIRRGVIEPAELAALLADDEESCIKLVDASFVMPGTPVDPRLVHRNVRIGDAVFFDIDEIADKSTPLPHMLPSPEEFSKSVSGLGIGNGDMVVVYDQSGIAMAAARVWWMFRVFGHDNVMVLNGGLPYWQTLGLPLNTEPPQEPEPARFKAHFRPELVKSAEELLELLGDRDTAILDARGTERFSGQMPEPRPGLRSGHIPGSGNIPFPSLIDPATGCLKDAPELRGAFEGKLALRIVTSCGSGVTACVLALGLFRLGHDGVAVYDGSWAEWGQEASGLPVETAAG